MMIYGYQKIFEDRLNQVMAVVPEWKDVPLEETIKTKIGSLAVWEDLHVEYYFHDEKQDRDDYEDDDDDNSDPPNRFSEMTIKVNGEWKSFKSMMVIYKNIDGLYRFLNQSWKPAEDRFQQELSELVTETRATETVLEILKLFFEDERLVGSDMMKKGHGGFIQNSHFLQALKPVTVDGERYYFNRRPDSRQLALRQMHQERNGARVPVGAMLWGAEGLKGTGGPFTAFWQGKFQVSDNLMDFDELFYSAMNKAYLYAQAPWLPLEDQNLEAGAILRVPTQNEAMRWLKGRRKDQTARKLTMDDIDSCMESTDQHELSDVDLPAGLPSAGFIRDSRSPITIPEGIPVVSDVGGALAILFRTDHGLFLSGRPLRSILRLLPRSRKTLWAIIAVPLSPFSTKASAMR